MIPQERAKLLISQLGFEGAKRQAQEEFGNAETEEEMDYQLSVIICIPTNSDAINAIDKQVLALKN